MRHKNTKQVLAGLMGSCLMLQLVAMPSMAQPAPQETTPDVPPTASTQGGKDLVNADTKWHYLDDNTDPAGTAGSEGYKASSWTAAAFDHSDWKTAAGPFSSKKGGADLGGGFTATTVLEGCDGEADTPAYFFRTTFTLDSLEGLTKLEGTMQHDDGAVVYINGERVAAYDADKLTGTNNMEYAGVSAGSPQTQNLTITDLSILQEGDNTLAVEIHNDRPSSSDVWFDFTSLTASDEPINQAPTDVNLSMGKDSSQMNLTWYASQDIPGKVLLTKES